MIEYEVQEIKFEHVYIEKLKQKAIRSHKIRDWLSLLNAYQQNTDFRAKNETIKLMHRMFILKEDFWITEAKRLIQKPQITQEEVQLVMLGLDDGFYEKVAVIIYKRLQQEIDSIVSGKNACLRTNFVLAKVEQIVEHFRHIHTNQFLSGLRNIYLKLKDEKKIREIFYRQIRAANNNVEISFDLYKSWEVNPEFLKKGHELYQEALNKWNDRQYNLQVKNYKNIDIRLVLLEIQEINPFDSLKYYEILSELQTDIEKLWFLRRVCLGMSQLSQEYMERLQLCDLFEEENLLEIYQNVLVISQECQMFYLKYLVRRINKHLIKPQSEEYNSTWGQKVQFFRQQISRLIDKPRLTPKVQDQIKQTYYNYWIDVETALVQDHQAIIQLFDIILKEKQTVEIYTKYSQSLLRLGKYKEAKNILKKCSDLFKLDYQAHKQYEAFIGIYGNIEDDIQLKKTKRFQKYETQSNHKSQKKSQKSAKKKEELIQPKKLQMDNQLQEMDVERQQVKVEGEEQVAQEKQQQGNSVHERVKNIEENEQPRKKIHTDSANTLFIKHIPPEWKEEDIKKIIKYTSFIREVRLVEKNGHPQSYCYIEMESEDAARAQVEENEHKSKYFIALSRPPAAFSQANTLFLCALPQTANEKKIRKLFQQFESSISEIRLVVNREKNIAYIDFDSEQSKNKAFNELKGKNLMVDSKRVLLRECKGNEKKKQNKVILLRNLSYLVKQSDIEKFFQGKSIEQIFIPKKKQDGKSKGFAYVEFQHGKDYQEALEKGTGMLRNRQFQIIKSDRQIQLPRERKDNSFQTDKRHTPKAQKKDNSFFSDIFK